MSQAREPLAGPAPQPLARVQRQPREWRSLGMCEPRALTASGALASATPHVQGRRWKRPTNRRSAAVAAAAEGAPEELAAVGGGLGLWAARGMLPARPALSAAREWRGFSLHVQHSNEWHRHHSSCCQRAVREELTRHASRCEAARGARPARQGRATSRAAAVLSPSPSRRVRRSEARGACQNKRILQTLEEDTVSPRGYVRAGGAC